MHIFSDGRKLAERLQTARRFQSAAMKRGIETEGVAAQAYSEVNCTLLDGMLHVHVYH